MSAAPRAEPGPAPPTAPAPAPTPAPAALAAPLPNALTVDVEEYFHAENLRPAAPPESWDRLPSRVEGQVERLLDLFSARGVQATFFTLGWVAERRPRLVAAIAARGHEVASHGYGHDMLTTLDPARFRGDLRRARAALEDAAQAPVEGYRAPTWSIVARTRWALDVLADEGYRYDSSIFPVRHDRYGIPGAPIAPYRVEAGGGAAAGAAGAAGAPSASGLLELPPLVWRVFGQNLPAAGGGYLRLLPFWYVRLALRQATRAGRPAVIYLHPWEIDPGQPRLPIGGLRAARHYRGLRRVLPRLDALLRRHRFGTARDLARAIEEGAARGPGPGAAASPRATS